MTEKRIKISSVVENQLPEFVKEEFPLASEFLKQYYLSLENQGSSYDLISNLDKYVKIDFLSNLTTSTLLTSNVSFFDSTINVESTVGFPETYGLIQIGSEIITYARKTSTSFTGCLRGFSGITSLENSLIKDQLVFSESSSEQHSESDEVLNLSVLFLQKFFEKIKTQITPGFEGRSFYTDIDERIFIKQSSDFYSSKGSERSFEILFRVLYGKDVEVIRPRDYLIQPSDAQYRITKDLVVEPIEGSVIDLENKTIFQDQVYSLPKARGTVTKVEKLIRSEKEYYVLSLDNDYQKDIDVTGTIFGSFSIHPKTLSITPIFDINSSQSEFTPNLSSIDVDSTVGFPKEGELLIEFSNGTQNVISYTDKTYTQFLNCSGITQEIPSGSEIKLNVYAYGYDNSQNIVKFRIGGVLSDINVPSQNFGFDVNDPIVTQALGRDVKDNKFNNWFFNLSVSNTTKSLELVDSSNNSYNLYFYDNHLLNVGDKISILPSYGRPGSEKIGTVISYKDQKSVAVTVSDTLNVSETFDIKKILSRFDSLNYTSLNKYTTNVQNVYIEDEKTLYVTSPSLPSYLNQKIDVNDRSIVFSGNFNGTDLNIGPHSFYTGDSVYYRSGGENNNLGIEDGFYFIKRINNSTVQLSRSKSNLFSNKVVSFSGNVVDNRLELSEFISGDTLEVKQLEPQKLVRKLEDPVNDNNDNQTLPGSTGILVNGVEILNYKSQNSIFYGPIEEILPVSGGSGYDVINPPILSITDSIGSGATAHCNVKGNLERIDIIDSGFDYLNDPKIEISGGNGFGASAKANLVSFDHYSYFNADISSGAVDDSTLEISFAEDHKFRDNERVIYDSQGGTVVGGLSTGTSYFVSVIDSKKIKLYSSYSDSISGINTVSITNNGNGIQRFKSANKKKKIGSITVTNSGNNYENKKRVCSVSGINTSSNTVTIKNHGFNDSEVVIYNYTENGISGLSTSSKYYVTKVDQDNFKLSSVGISSTQPLNINYITKNYVDFISVGSGDHIFNYEPISVTVSGNIGVSTLTGQDFNAVLQPIFRGSIESVNVQNGGNNYGSENILNYNRQPNFTILNGTGAQVTPTISNGSITDVIINSSGIYYNSPPNLIINGSGYGAILTPIISDGKLTSVKVISGGIGYSESDTTISVLSSGLSSKFESVTKYWRINLFERLLQNNQITSDDGVLGRGFSDFGLQYFHLYSPRKLRSSVYGSRFKNGQIFYEEDLKILNGKEVESKSHSPIIGWAYDGNPIYGPYGYTSKTGGSIRCMESGYQISLKPGRPSTSLYPIGFFVDDYEFFGNGDLDEHNGRFCATPEYPNGIYAYFTTIDTSFTESSGPFKDYRLPKFPYFIGNTYKSKLIDFNIQKSSNQLDIDINETKWLRNTNPYGITNENTKYDFFLTQDERGKKKSKVKSVKSGFLTNVGIVTGGKDFKVGDSVIFKEVGLESKKPKVSVSSVKGKVVNNISIARSEISGVQFVPQNNSSYFAISDSPHELNNLDFVTITSDFESPQVSNIRISQNELITTSGIGSTSYTGMTTYFNVYGNLTNVRENDIYRINDESIKILKVDFDSSRVRVLRNINEVSGITSYSAGAACTELSRKLSFNYSTNNEYNYKLNKQFYFDPSESLGVGTISGPGITTDLYFTNPGTGLTQISIPTRSVYLPNHQLLTGDELIYSSNGGNQISISTDGISSYQVSDGSVFYATRLNSNLIGISSYRVGLGTTGVYSGISTSSNLLYFTSVGTETAHSFATNYQNILDGKVSKIEATVSTSSTHGLNLNDVVDIKVVSGISTIISVSYNDYNRRSIFGKKDFLSVDVNISKNTINIPNHGFYTSQKVIHTSTSSSGGLQNQSIYYVIVVDKDTIKLSDSYYYSSRKERNIIDITSASFGSILPVNPPINLTNKNSLIFDVSDPTLSFSNSGILYSAFDLKFYIDPHFNHEFDFTNISSVDVVRTGRVGIDTNATVSLVLNDETPTKLYYNLSPTNLKTIPTIKSEVIVDYEIDNNNTINVVESIYSGTYAITGITSTTFKYNLKDDPEESSYDQTSSNITYTTTSSTAYGEIDDFRIEFDGRNIKKDLEIEGVSSISGYDEILEVESNVGAVVKTKINDIGLDYSSDYSLRPTAKLPDIVNAIPQSSIESIGVSSVGRGYSLSPDLIVIDGFTKKVIEDIDLSYDIDLQKVNIIKNTKSINNTAPTIIPINNTNGISISSIEFISSTKDVVVTLGSSFSDIEDFPFEIGSKVLVENVSVGIASTSKGYNSSNYDYSLFTITNIDPNIGGIGATVSYSMSDYLLDDEIVGTFDPENSSGLIVPEKYFPIFNVNLKKNDFYAGEKIVRGSDRGEIISWDKNREILKVSFASELNEGDVVRGESSDSSAIVSKVVSRICDYVVGSASTVFKGWQTETGFLNNDFQRIHDSDYYQYFSYSLKSEVPLDTWDNAVANLNHTSGFKRFSELILESTPKISSGISTDQNLGDFSAISDISRVIDLNCVYDFDLVSENNLNIDGYSKSDEIRFNSEVLQDYIESVGNRVLIIDDISQDFNDQPRPTKFSVVDRFSLDSRSIKYIAFVQDNRFSSQRETLFISLLHDGTYGYINQYGSVNSYSDLGFFDFSISGNEGNLLFYPERFSINDYSISLVSFDIRDSIASIGSTDIGDVCFVGSATSTIPAGVSSSYTIVGIASTYRSSKVLVQIESTDSSYYEFDELTVIHDNNDIILQEYGQLTSGSLSSSSGSGFGTYHAYYSGSNINIDIIPSTTTSVQYNVNSAEILLSSTSSSGVGSEIFNNSKIESHYVAISSSPSPGITTIASYNSEYNGSYFFVSIEDLTNNQYQVSEVVVIDDDINVGISEFGIIQTGSSIGSIGSTVSGSGRVDLTFTPNADIDVEVRTYSNCIGEVNTSIDYKTIDFTNSFIRTGYGFYEGTDNDVKKQFNLTHDQLPIFERYFDGSSSSVVDTDNDFIRLPNHYFVTGEEIRYSFAGAGTTQCIGISTTNIPGIGVTDKLPSTLYIVKENDLNVKVAASASDALLLNPNTLDIVSVGIGTSHRFVSTNQNSRVMINIDNLTQSPIVSTSVTTTVAEDIEVVDTRIKFSGITSFFGGDLIKIDDEIMRINSVGLGSTNVVLVQRFWMGTGIASHAQNSIITKVSGDYNIVDNQINFVSAPYGLKPISSTTNPPSERDWIGVQTHSTFHGRSFIRSGFVDGLESNYSKNYIFDDISSSFNGISTQFTLKSNKTDITGFSTSNAIVLINNIFQGPSRLGSLEINGDYKLNENSGLTTISFVGSATSISNDVNTSSIPRGGIIVTIGSSSGFGYQPLVSAGGTAIISGFGTISSISIGNSGSGYRVGIQTIVNVGVTTSNLGTRNIEFIGTAAISGGHIVSVAITNPGTGYTSTNPPIVIFDDPLSYDNIPLIYSSSSPSGFGTEAKVDIVVGQGSSIISFNIKNTGYGYGQTEVLTVESGGILGIPTNPSLPFEEFAIQIDRTFADKFSGWSIGDLQVIDPIDSLFDNERISFPIKINGEQTTIRSRKGSNIQVKANLLIFINDILQVPDISYTFNGGSIITFSEPPKSGDTSKILFYRGTGEIDTANVDILEKVKEGDTLRINSDDEYLKQNTRLVTNIVSTDIVKTNTYSGPGLANDETLLRPVIWCRQTDDKIINNQEVSKDRVLYESLINPTSNVIENVGTSSTQIWVESVKTFFDSHDEYLHDGTSEKPQNKIKIVSQDSLVAASATAIVSSAGTISSIIISNGGIGYTSSNPPQITIQNPVGLGTTQRSSATAVVSVSGTVSNVIVSSPGTGYTFTNPPLILIESPTIKNEVISDVDYSGDFGTIVGYGISTISGSDKNIFDFYIPQDSFLRNTDVVGTAITISQINVGDFFVVQNSNVGVATTNFFTYRTDGSIIGLSTHYVDGIYQVDSVETIYKDLVGIGSTYVRRVFAVVESTTGISTIGLGSSTIFFDSTYYTWDYLGITTYVGGMISTSNYFGEFSWGRISNFTRTDPQEFECYGFNGISTSASVIRFNPLKYKNYVN